MNFRALLAFPEELKFRTKHTERVSNHFTPPIQTLGARCYDWPPDFALHFVFVTDAATPQIWYFQVRGAISFMKAKVIPFKKACCFQEATIIYFPPLHLEAFQRNFTSGCFFGWPAEVRIQISKALDGALQLGPRSKNWMLRNWWSLFPISNVLTCVC